MDVVGVGAPVEKRVVAPVDVDVDVAVIASFFVLVNEPPRYESRLREFVAETVFSGVTGRAGGKGTTRPSFKDVSNGSLSDELQAVVVHAPSSKPRRESNDSLRVDGPFQLPFSPLDCCRRAAGVIRRWLLCTLLPPSMVLSKSPSSLSWASLLRFTMESRAMPPRPIVSES